MKDEDRIPYTGDDISVSRRGFGALSVAAGIAATAPAKAALAVTETEVTVKTPDGNCDAAFIHPTTGAYPGVVIWTDIFGLRPSMRDMGKRLAAEGYSVLVPNPFYRTQKAPVFGDVSKFDFGNTADRAKLGPLTGPINQAGAIERDSIAHVAFLDAQSQVDKKKKIGTQGYCMGGPLVFKTLASNVERVGAGATFHGGGLTTDKPDSPHLLIPKMNARLYIAIADSDDMKEPNSKTVLRAAFDTGRVPAEIEVYTGTQHGWCVPDMPAQAGKPIYSKPDADRAWGKLVALYKSTLD